MNHQSVFKLLIVLQLLFLIVSVGSDFYLLDSLPIALKEYVQFEQNINLNTFEEVLLLSFIPLSLVYIVASIYLYRLKSWAIKPYIYTNIALFVMSAFISPTVGHAVTMASGSMFSALIGLTVGFIYLSDVFNTSE